MVVLHSIEGTDKTKTEFSVREIRQMLSKYINKTTILDQKKKLLLLETIL